MEASDADADTELSLGKLYGLGEVYLEKITEALNQLSDAESVLSTVLTDDAFHQWAEHFEDKANMDYVLMQYVKEMNTQLRQSSVYSDLIGYQFENLKNELDNILKNQDRVKIK
jgi:hypothetical protein